MPEAILTILKFCFLALLYLFLARVVRVVYLEIGGRSRRSGAREPAAPTPRRSRRGARRDGDGTARLQVVEPADAEGRVFEVGDEVTVGRAAGCHVSLVDDTYVSQMHARVFRRDDTLYVEDLGSTNGTYLNRKKLTCEMPVKRGDRIQVGRTVLELTR